MNLGIQLHRSSPELTIEWGNLLLNLGEMVGQSLLLAPTAGGSLPSILTAAINMVRSASLADPIEARAFGLFALSVATAVDELVPRTGADGNGVYRSAAKSLTTLIAAQLDKEKYYLDQRFFSRPSSNKLFSIFRPDLVEILSTIRGNNKVDLGSKLDAAFNSSVHKVWRSRPEYFSPIAEALATPGLEAARYEIEWCNYRSRLIERFSLSTLFGQEATKVALSDLYVPLDARWEIPSEGDQEKYKFGNLHNELNAWLDEANVDDPVRLVFGGPGSGKSSFARAFAAELAQRDDRRPIFIELQHTSALGDLRQQLEQKLVRDDQFFSADPFSVRDPNSPIVLIFDGLDELVMPGTAASSWVADGFVVSLKALLRSLNATSPLNAKVIVTGRTAIMQSFAKSFEIAPRCAMEVQGFLYHTETGRARSDKRPEWWKKYREAFGLSDSYPEAFAATGLDEVTSEPLLCFLLAISGYLTSNWQDAAENTNRIYDRLIGEIWERRWGAGVTDTTGRVGPAYSLKTRAEFDLLMETMALAAWWGGENRVATKASFDLAIVATNATEIWQKFIADDGDDMSNLALTFYFKRSELDTQGFEFTHKTFSEYLVGRFLLRQIVEKIARPLRTRDIDHDEASERWCKFGVQGYPNSSISSFVRNEARLVAQDAILYTADEVTSWLSHTISRGFPVHGRSSENFVLLEQKNRCGFANVIMCLTSIARSKDEFYGESWSIDVDFGDDRSGPARLITRLVNFEGGFVSGSLDFYRFNFNSEHGAFATSLFFPEGSLDYCKLDGAVLARSFLGRTSLVGASLRSAMMDDSELSRVDFGFADLTHCRLQNSDLKETNFIGAKIDGMYVEGADIRDAILPFEWWNMVNPSTFFSPPKNLPILYRAGSRIEPSAVEYPDMARIYARLKRKEIAEIRRKRAEPGLGEFEGI